MTACKPPLLIHLADGRYQAWCPTCRWESHEYFAISWAKTAADRHTQSPEREAEQ